MGNRRHLCLHLHECFIWICRVWGILSAIALWGVGIETAYRKHPLGAYLLVIAFVVSICEAIFIIHFWVVFQARDQDSKCVKIWGTLTWLDNWKKGVFYLLLSAGCFAQPHDAWLAIVPGVMLVICGILYCVKIVTTREDVATDEVNKNHQTYGRFDEVQEDIEENLTETLDGLQSEETTVADQDEILDV